jgi:hypothetical protein
MENTKNEQQCSIHDVISRFIEDMAQKHNLDVQMIKIKYDRRCGELEIYEDRHPHILLDTFIVNDL